MIGGRGDAGGEGAVGAAGRGRATDRVAAFPGIGRLPVEGDAAVAGDGGEVARGEGRWGRVADEDLAGFRGEDRAVVDLGVADVAMEELRVGVAAADAVVGGLDPALGVGEARRFGSVEINPGRAGVEAQRNVLPLVERDGDVGVPELVVEDHADLAIGQTPAGAVLAGLVGVEDALDEGGRARTARADPGGQGAGATAGDRGLDGIVDAIEGQRRCRRQPGRSAVEGGIGALAAGVGGDTAGAFIEAVPCEQTAGEVAAVEQVEAGRRGTGEAVVGAGGQGDDEGLGGLDEGVDHRRDDDVDAGGIGRDGRAAAERGVVRAGRGAAADAVIHDLGVVESRVVDALAGDAEADGVPLFRQRRGEGLDAEAGETVEGGAVDSEVVDRSLEIGQTGAAGDEVVGRSFVGIGGHQVLRPDRAGRGGGEGAVEVERGVAAVEGDANAGPRADRQGGGGGEAVGVGTADDLELADAGAVARGDEELPRGAAVAELEDRLVRRAAGPFDPGGDRSRAQVAEPATEQDVLAGAIESEEAVAAAVARGPCRRADQQAVGGAVLVLRRVGMAVGEFVAGEERGGRGLGGDGAVLQTAPFPAEVEAVGDRLAVDAVAIEHRVAADIIGGIDPREIADPLDRGVVADGGVAEEMDVAADAGIAGDVAGLEACVFADPGVAADHRAAAEEGATADDRVVFDARAGADHGVVEHPGVRTDEGAGFDRGGAGFQAAAVRMGQQGRAAAAGTLRRGAGDLDLVGEALAGRVADVGLLLIEMQGRQHLAGRRGDGEEDLVLVGREGDRVAAAVPQRRVAFDAAVVDDHQRGAPVGLAFGIRETAEIDTDHPAGTGPGGHQFVGGEGEGHRQRGRIGLPPAGIVGATEEVGDLLAGGQLGVPSGQRDLGVGLVRIVVGDLAAREVAGGVLERRVGREPLQGAVDVFAGRRFPPQPGGEGSRAGARGHAEVGEIVRVLVEVLEDRPGVVVVDAVAVEEVGRADEGQRGIGPSRRVGIETFVHPVQPGFAAVVGVGFPPFAHRIVAGEAAALVHLEDVHELVRHHPARRIRAQAAGMQVHVAEGISATAHPEAVEHAEEVHLPLARVEQPFGGVDALGGFLIAVLLDVDLPGFLEVAEVLARPGRIHAELGGAGRVPNEAGVLGAQLERAGVGLVHRVALIDVALGVADAEVVHREGGAADRRGIEPDVPQVAAPHRDGSHVDAIDVEGPVFRDARVRDGHRAGGVETGLPDGDAGVGHPEEKFDVPAVAGGKLEAELDVIVEAEVEVGLRGGGDGGPRQRRVRAAGSRGEHASRDALPAHGGTGPPVEIAIRIPFPTGPRAGSQGRGRIDRHLLAPYGQAERGKEQGEQRGLGRHRMEKGKSETDDRLPGPGSSRREKLRTTAWGARDLGVPASSVGTK